MLLFFFTITFRSILQKLWPAVLRLVFQPKSTDEWALSRAHAENVTEILVRRETDKYGGCTLGVCVFKHGAKTLPGENLLYYQNITF